MKKTVKGTVLILLISVLVSMPNLGIVGLAGHMNKFQDQQLHQESCESRVGPTERSFTDLDFFELSEPPTEWNKTYGGIDFDCANSVIETDDGYAIAGYTTSFGAGRSDVWLIKTDSAGHMKWNKTYGGTDSDAARSIIETNDDGYAIAGWTRSFGVGEEDAWLVKTDSAGNMQWNKTYGGIDFDCANSVIETDDGYAIAGYTTSFGAGRSDVWLIKTDSAGHMKWNKTYGGTDSDAARSIIETNDDGYAIAGWTRSFGVGEEDAWLVKTDSAGNMQWNITYGGIDFDCANSVIETDDGYAIAGYTTSFGAGRSDVWLIKTDSAGHMKWNKTYGGTDWDWAYSFIQTSDGGYASAGQTQSFGAGERDAWLIKTDSGGNHEWNRTYGGANYDWVQSVIQTSDGGYALAGSTASFGAGNRDFWLIKANSTGHTEWNETYGGTCIDENWSFVQSGDGGYALVGYTTSFGVGEEDAWLVKTDSAGNMQWNITYGGTGTDTAASIVETSEGGYTIAGQTTSFGAGHWDFWLIKLAGKVHDVAISNGTSSKTIVGKGYTLSINVTLVNEGDFVETFDVTTYVNTTAIQTKTVTLPSGNSTIVTFTWNTSGVAKGNYTIKAEATPVPGETDTADNTLIDGWVMVVMFGDFNGDGIVDMSDIAAVARCHGAMKGDPKYNPNYDINDDEIIDISDAAAVARRYGDEDP